MRNETEMLVGYLVDLHCLREWPQYLYSDKARAHPTTCALKGSHVESGYAIIQDDEYPVILDASATPLIVEALVVANVDTGIRMRVEREMRDGQMRTVLVTTSE